MSTGKPALKSEGYDVFQPRNQLKNDILVKPMERNRDWRQTAMGNI
jgi:hypothetical protein